MTSPSDRSLSKKFDESMREETRSLRTDFLTRVPAFSIAAAVEQLSRRSNSAVTLNLLRIWLGEGAIFSILHYDLELLPEFQFDDGGTPQDAAEQAILPHIE